MVLNKSRTFLNILTSYDFNQSHGSQNSLLQFGNFSFNNEFPQVAFFFVTSISETSKCANQYWYLNIGANYHFTNNNTVIFSILCSIEILKLLCREVIAFSLKLCLIVVFWMLMKLCKMLFVYQLAKNLVSMKQLYVDNDVMVEFFSNSFFIKELSNNKVLIKNFTSFSI